MTYLDSVANTIRQEVPADALPSGDTTALFRMYAVLLLAKGSRVAAEDVHNAWVAWMANLGESHEAMVPFAALDAETKAEDSPYVAAIRAAAQLHAKQ